MSTPTRYLCIHAHLYQPPRENPWLETVESQDSAAPYHDWNDRITAECYAPNGAARIVNRQNEIIRILSNYARISFNFGPTLLSWLEENTPRVYRRILDADRIGRQRFSGHGSAIAQVYNHIIMPLANTRDRITQIRWGIADFKYRFHRVPEGMWLPETAVDTESLDLLAEHNIRFVILAPSQCARVRPIDGANSQLLLNLEKQNGAHSAWTETPHANVDPTRAYRIQLKNGRSIAAFFYDGPRSRAIAFEGLLNSGENFAKRLLEGFDSNATHPQLVHVATDGESYGHHHKHGEMALAWMLHHFEETGEVRLTNYGEFLEKFPPQYEAQIVEDSSWSCAHGIERWRSDCGCNGGHAGWNQQWRAPLRAALDFLRDAIAPLVHETGRTLFRDVDAARNAYIAVVLDHSRASVDAFLKTHAAARLSPAARTTALQLMELERHAMLMYTSCGWFFDEISGIETVQIIAYAARVLQLAADLFGPAAAQLEPRFIAMLAEARSNVPTEQNGAEIYRHRVRPMQVGLEQVAAHYAISSVFTTYPEEARVFCYTVRRESFETASSGRIRLVTGRAHLCSEITEESETVVFAALHLGDQNITAVVRRWDTDARQQYTDFLVAARDALNRADLPALIRLFDRTFGEHAYSLGSLFKDEQQRILELIFTATLQEVEANLSAIYQNQSSLVHFLSQSGLPRPRALTAAATFAINAGLRHALESDPIDTQRLRSFLEAAITDQIDLDQPALAFLAAQKVKQALAALEEAPASPAALENALITARATAELPFEINLWQAQNIWYEILRGSPPPYHSPADHSPAHLSEDWRTGFLALGHHLHICAEDLILEEEGQPNPAGLDEVLL